VNEEEIVQRIIKRRVCRQCGAVYHLEHKPPRQPDVCDVCQGETYLRSDDSEPVVRERLKVYRERTLPLVEFYKERGVLVDVDGQGGIDEVYSRILKAVKAKKR